MRRLIVLLLFCVLAQPSLGQVLSPPTHPYSMERPARPADSRSDPAAWTLTGIAWTDDTEGRRWVFLQNTDLETGFSSILVYIDGEPMIQHRKFAENNCQMATPATDGVFRWFRKVSDETSCAAYDRMIRALSPVRPLEAPIHDPSLYLERVWPYRSPRP